LKGFSSMMLKTLKRRWGVVILGIALLVWGATSGFADWKDLAAIQPDALDNPDASSSPWIYPTSLPTLGLPANGSTLTPFQPTGPSVEPTLDTSSNGDAQAFTVPYTTNPSAPTPTPAPVGMDPDRIVIPDIQLDAPIQKVPYRLVRDDATNMVLQQWLVPNQFAVGWQGDSAQLGVPGNTVLDGHHNEYGKVFRYLVNTQPGETIDLYSGPNVYKYTITNKMILLERNQPLSVRFNNARWLLPTSDERITLVTCWPYTSNTHRLIVVAVPADKATTATKPSP
jgi:LPXTG-site transpeptidase (sortase) family protein